MSRFFKGEVRQKEVQQRPRFVSETFNKKLSSFEILCFDENKDTVINKEYFSQRKETNIEAIEDYDEFTDELCLTTESNDKETTVSNIKKIMKTTSFESSYSFQNSYVFEIGSDIRKQSMISRSIFESVVSSFGKLKRCKGT